MGTRVYIGRLPYNVREKDIERFFKGYGRLRDIMLKNGYGFVEFEDYRDADDAVYELNGKNLCGERISIEHARGTPRGSDRYYDNSFDRFPPRRGGGGGGGRRTSARDKYGPPTRTENRIVVENLSSRVSWQDLKDYMRQAGEVTYADAHRDKKNEGVVEFSSYSDMKRAIEKLDGTEINGRKIKLIEVKPKRSRRSRSRSDSRSRSRSRSHSGSRKSRSGSRKSASHSVSRSKSRSHSKSKSRSKSHSKSKSRSQSPVKSPEKEEAKSKSRSKSRSKSKSKSRSKSKSKSRSKSKSKSRSKSKSKSRSKSISKSRSKSPSPSRSESKEIEEEKIVQ